MVAPETTRQCTTLGTRECGLIWREDLLVSLESRGKFERGEMDTKETMMQLDKYSITDVRQMQFPNF